MKSKAEPKNTPSKTGEPGEHKKIADQQGDVHPHDDSEEDLPEEHLKGLDEALKGADRGEPVTLQEFKKMAKKWSSK